MLVYYLDDYSDDKPLYSLGSLSPSKLSLTPISTPNDIPDIIPIKSDNVDNDRSLDDLFNYILEYDKNISIQQETKKRKRSPSSPSSPQIKKRRRYYSPTKKRKRSASKSASSSKRQTNKKRS
jgi:hypothetical protein